MFALKMAGDSSNSLVFNLLLYRFGCPDSFKNDSLRITVITQMRCRWYVCPRSFVVLRCKTLSGSRCWYSSHVSWGIWPDKYEFQLHYCLCVSK